MENKKLIIVGGVAGGATAAARARRLDEHADIIMFERGEYISFANCGLPYYIGETIKERNKLMVTTVEALQSRYRIDVRTGAEVVAIDRKQKRVTVRSGVSGELYHEEYDVLILSPGAEPIRPEVDNIDNDRIFTLRNIPDTDRIKRYIDTNKPKHAVVVGGGFIGLEMVENLVARDVPTTLVEMANQVLGPIDIEMAAVIHSYLREHGVRLELEKTVAGFSQQETDIVVHTEPGDDLVCDMVILAIGVKPENRLALEAGLTTGAGGAIRTDAAMKTSDTHIFAVGDAVEVKHFVDGHATLIPLAGPANKQGRIAAGNSMGRKAVSKGSQGTSIVKIFDMVVGATGLSEKTLMQSNISYQKSYTDGQSHASYYPGSDLMMIKLLYSPSDGQLFGAQIVGGKGVDKRTDVLATAIRGRMSVYDLEELELAYAPPFSSAKDPVNIAGFHAVNIMNGDVKCVHWHQMGDLDQQSTVIIDVRTTKELETDGEIEGAVNIPIDELRDKIFTLDSEKTYVLVCLAGLRSYIGCRILDAHGFDCYSLSGGYGLYKHVVGMGDARSTNTVRRSMKRIEI